jgi:hypothetical protein
MSTPLRRLLEALDSLPTSQFDGAFPVVLMMLAEHLQPLQPPLQRVLDDFTKSTGISPSMTPPQLHNVWQAHMRRHQLDESVWRTLISAVAGDAGELAAASRALGAATPAFTPPSVPPAGAVAGGPLARFNAQRTVDTKASKKTQP